jgi:hypothetical protein
MCLYKDVLIDVNATVVTDAVIDAEEINTNS